MSAPATETDGHWPVWAAVPALGVVIGCECGKRPAKRAARVSMQHTWHQTHRRTLRLAPVEYQWPDGATQEARDGGTPLSTGGYVQVRGAEWRDGGWQPVTPTRTTPTGPRPTPGSPARPPSPSR